MNPNKQIVQPVYVVVEEMPGGPRLVSNKPGEAAQAESKFTNASAGTAQVR